MAPAASVPAPISPQVLARAISSATMNACWTEAPGRPPYSTGHACPRYPAAYSRATQARSAGTCSGSGARTPTCLRGPGPYRAMKARTSAR